MITPKRTIELVDKIRELSARDDRYLNIYSKYFANGPLRRIRYPLEHYGLGNKKVLDIGCGYGQNLIYFGDKSLGIDIDRDAIDFIKTIGGSAMEKNLDEPLLLPDKEFEVIWCSNVIEHVTAPHRLLIDLRNYLKNDGLLILSAPIIPSWIWGKFLVFILRGLFKNASLPYLAADHVNAFTVKTLKFYLQRAGYNIREVNTFYPANKRVNSIINPFVVNNWHTVFFVATKIQGWDYPNRSLKKFMDGGIFYKKP